MVWVLLRAYKLSKEQVLLVLQEIHDNEAFVIENEDYFIQALNLYKKNNIDFSDCMILIATQAENISYLYSFDTKFGKISGVKILK